MISPGFAGFVAGQQHLSAGLMAPGIEAFPVEQVMRGFHPVQNGERSIRRTPPEHILDRADHRRASQTTRDDEHVLPLRRLHGPSHPEGTPHSHALAFLHSAQDFGDPSHHTNRVIEKFRLIRIGHNGNGHFANTEHIQHIELSGLKPERLPVSRVRELQMKRHNIRGLLFLLHDHRRMNKVGIMCHS